MYDQSVLTHKDLPLHPIQCTGHADLVEDKNGNWWAVFLGVRPIGGKYSVLGRETFLAPVSWNEQGWPIIDHNTGAVGLVIETSTLLGEQKQHLEFFDDFTRERLDYSWTFVRTDDPSMYSLNEKPRGLRLQGKKNHLRELGTWVRYRGEWLHISMKTRAKTLLLAFRPGFCRTRLA